MEREFPQRPADKEIAEKITISHLHETTERYEQHKNEVHNGQRDPACDECISFGEEILYGCVIRRFLIEGRFKVLTKRPQRINRPV